MFDILSEEWICGKMVNWMNSWRKQKQSKRVPLEKKEQDQDQELHTAHGGRLNFNCFEIFGEKKPDYQKPPLSF